jgi:4-amino-4-deoxy-L-arabinose transferase-like glycosyltransferase
MSDAASTPTNLVRSLRMSTHETQWRTLLTILAAALALVFMAFAAFLFYAGSLDRSLLPDALNWALAGALGVGVAVYLHRVNLPRLDIATTTTTVPIRWRVVALGALSLLMLAIINGHGLPRVHYTLQLILLVVGILLVVRGMSADWCWPRLERREWLALAAVTLLALGLRLWVLEDGIHRFVDEIPFANAVTRLWSTPDTLILLPFNNVASFTWLYPYLQAGSVALFGPTLTGLRVVSVLFGTLTIPALYFLARTLFGRGVAILAALVLVAFPPHLHFSRLALNNIAEPLFGTLALAFTARGLQSNRRSDFVVAGAALGLTQYFYEGGRLLFPPLVLLWFFLCWLAGRRWRLDGRPPLAGLLVALLVAMPLYYTLLAQHASLTPRLDTAGLRLDTPYMSATRRWETLADPFLLVVSLPDQGWFYSGQHPLVLRPLVPLFLVGTAFLFWRLRSPGALLVLLWLLFTSLGNVLLTDRAWSPRYVVVFPALALVLAIGLWSALQFLWPAPGRPQQRDLLAGALALALVAGQAAYYFGDHLSLVNHQYEHVKDAEDALYRSVNFPPDTAVHIIVQGEVWDLNIKTLLRFWNLDLYVDAWYPAEISPDVLRSMVEMEVDHAFFIAPEDSGTLTALRRYFDLLPPQFSPFNIPAENQLALYYAPRDLQDLPGER